MKRKDLLKYLRTQGCTFVREGARHNEIRDILAKKICKDLGIPPVLRS